MTAFRDILQSRSRPAARPQPQPAALAAPWRPMRQQQAARWAMNAPPGQSLRGPHHRAMRLLMEALELARASGVTEAQMQAMLSATFIRDASDPRRTAGAVGVALLMLCDALNLDAEETEVTELNRLLALLDPQRRKPTATPATPPRAAAATRPAPPPGHKPAKQDLREDFPHSAH